MKWYTGPLIWDTSSNPFPYWRSPDRCLGFVDCRSIPQQSQRGGDPGLAIFAMPDDSVLPTEYELLGAGHHRDIKTSQRLKDILPKRRGWQIEGDDLLGNLWSLLTIGADPTGGEFAKPIMPCVNGNLELSIAGNVHSERFRWGKSRETNLVRDVVRLGFADAMAAANANQLKDAIHHLRVLDALCDKYGIEDWKEVVPPGLQKDVPGRVKHETSLLETFNTADSATLGPVYSWTDLTGDNGVVSNAVEVITNDAAFTTLSRADSDLSGIDHYTELVMLNAGSITGTKTFGAVCRKDSSATLTMYFAEYRRDTTAGRMFKLIASVFTGLGTDTIAAANDNDIIRCHCNGSTISRYLNGVQQTSATDTAITTGLRGGISLFSTTGTSPRGDTWQAADLAASGILYTQLERSTRGIMRGVYTRF